MARTFLVAMAASESLPLILYYFLDELETDEGAALRAEVHTRQEWKVHEYELTRDAKRLISERKNDMRVRLEARSRGLLEVPTNSLHSRNAASLKVEFLHRAVRDYFEKPEIVGKLIRQANKAEKSGSEFSPAATLCHCLLACIKMLPPGEPGDHSADELLEFVDDLLWYAYRAETSTNAAQEDVLDDLDKTLGIIFPPETPSGLSTEVHNSSQILHPKLLENYDSISLIELCAQRGLSEYISLKISPELVAGPFKYPLLLHALCPMRSPKYGFINTDETVAGPDKSVWGTFLDSYSWNGLSSTAGHDRIVQSQGLPPIEVVDRLLRAGANSNVKLGTSSAFDRIVNGHFDDAQRDQRLHLLQSFVLHGASPNFKLGDYTIWQQ